MKKIILFFNLFLVFNLGFSAPQSNTTGGYINNKWYAWYDNTFLGKETVVSEKFHKFKSLEVDVVGVEIEYEKGSFSERIFKNIYLKVTNFKAIDLNGNVYTKENYPNEQNKIFIPMIITDESINRFLVDNHKNVKFIGTERKNSKTGRTELDTVPTKLVLNNSNGFKICATSNGKKLYYSLWKCEN